MASHLNLTVVVDEHNELSLQPAFVTTARDAAPEPPPPAPGGTIPPLYQEALRRTSLDPGPRHVLTVEVAGQGSDVLSRTQFPLLPLCTDGKAPSNAMVAGTIPWSEDATAIRFYRGERLLRTEAVPTGRPEIKLTWDPPEPVEGRQQLSWMASHSEGRPLHYMVLYSHTAGRSWEPLSVPLEEDRFEVAFDELPGGEGMIAVLASDGINTARVETRTFAVPVKPLFPLIQTPGDGDVVDAGTPVWFQGQAFDREAQARATEELVWSSSLQGELGSGIQVVAELQPGNHKVTLRAGSGERQGETAINVSARG